MFKSLLGLSLALSFGVLAINPAVAQGKKPDKKSDQKTDQKAAADKPTPPKEEEKKETKEQRERREKGEDYDKAVKDLTKYEGNFTLYTRKKDVLLELPEDKLDKIFLIQATLETGAADQGLQAGDPVGLFGVDAFKFEKNDDAVWLERPNLRYRWDAHDPLALASQRSFPNAILGSFRIEQSNPDKKLLLVNITPIFSGDIFKLTEMVDIGLGGAYMLDREKSWPDKVNSFPDNTVVTMQLHYMSARGLGEGGFGAAGFAGTNPQLEDPRSAPLRVTYDMWFRKDSDYTPRLADPRIGYFTQDFYDVNKFLSDDDRTQRYIMRMNLKKKDPTAAVSEPVKPITWVIDPSVPPQYRGAVKEGILRWNKAFETIGYKNAMVVKDAPDDPNYNHADGRYNVIRWTMSENTPYAVTWFRTDPFTGEILNCSITFDANMLAYALQEHQSVATPAATMTTRVLDVLKRTPSRPLGDDDWIWDSDKEIAEKEAEAKYAELGWHRFECEQGLGLAESSQFALSTVAAVHGLKVDKEAYAKQFIEDAIQHETGHSLGLRHNFAGSSNLTTAQLSDDDLTSKEGISASVMDYVPVNILAALKGSGNFFSPTVGKYDIWAVKYGYMDTKAHSPSAEKSELDAVAQLSGTHGYEYLSDENADNWDPYDVRFDSSKDPINYSAKMLEATKRVKDYAILELPKPGESYAKRTQMILESILTAFREGQYAARFVGGVHMEKNFRSDSNEQPTLAPVNPNDQREAIHLIAQNLLSSSSFKFTEKVAQNLTLDPNSDASQTWTAPIREILGAQEERMFAKLMSAAVTDRIAENQYKSVASDHPYTIDEHFGLLMGTIFSEVGKDEEIAPVRRDLQRFAVSVLIIQSSAPAGAINEDVRMLASDTLRRLDTRFQSALATDGKLPEMTQVHLRDTEAEIHRFLERQFGGGGN